ncbi:MAG: hypothetical protein FJW40_08780 [Acidobacteria bacterium]|nr:hypothetical protein [Acidobacteriota bacterium]
MPDIHMIKEQSVPETPLVIFDCEFPSGQVHRWSTHRVTVEGEEYSPRVLGHSLFDLRSGADEGIDAASKIALTLANADSLASQLDRAEGFKGSKLTARFVFQDLKTDTTSAGPVVVFQGLGNAPEDITESELRVSFGSRLSLQRIAAPALRIQRHCQWTFPETAAQRQEAVSGGDRGKYSPYFPCGYSPDQPGGSGNLNGAAPFTSCNFTRSQCAERGMLSTDSASRPTRRFGGIGFVPANVLVRSHGERGMHVSAAADNRAVYNDTVPMIYGTCWYQPPVTLARNDGNLTRMEVLLGLGEIQGVLKVLVNGVEVPQGQAGRNMTGTGWFNPVSLGNRTGNYNLDFTAGAPNTDGDPYGSMAVLSVVVPSRLSSGAALPRVEVLVQGLKLSVFDEAGLYVGEQFTNNPAWVLLDLLRRSGWDHDELDLASFGKAAVFCAGTVPSQDLNGNPISIPRYQCNLPLRRRRSLADVVRGVRLGAALFLAYGINGRLQLFPEGSLASQQPMKPAGSNAAAVLNGGWPAYEFGDGVNGSSGLLRRDNGEPAIRFWSRSNAETPNRFSVEFQDELNEFQQDSLSLVHSGDSARAGQEVQAVLPAMGLPNPDQAARIARLALDRAVLGNRYVEFETSMKGLGLRPGDLITLTYLKEGLNRTPFRVTKVSPRLNFETVLITAQIHDDAWYGRTGLAHSTGRRQPDHDLAAPRPLVGTVAGSDGRTDLGIAETAVEQADGSVLVQLAASFVAPAKPVPGKVGVPLLSLSPVIASTGGTLAGNQTLYYAVSGVDAGGNEGPLSFVVRAVIPAGTNTNKVTLTGLSLPAVAAMRRVYRGPSPRQLLRIAESAVSGNQFVDEGVAAMLLPPPDDQFDHANVYWRPEVLAETQADLFGASSVGASGLALSVNAYRGMTVRITRGKGAPQERTIAANTDTALSVSSPWDIVPDGSSYFAVAESSWRFGARTESSPAVIEVPNRAGETVHVLGAAANAQDVECPYEISPVTRVQVTGDGGMNQDAYVPGEPVYSLFTPGDGTLSIAGFGFASLENTRTIEGASITVHLVDELAPVKGMLASSATAGAGVLTISSPMAVGAGDYLQVGSEIVLLDAVAGTALTVTRGQLGTTAVSHASGAMVWKLERRVRVIPFVRDFFGGEGSGDFSHSIELPYARVAATEVVMTNSRGDSPVGVVSVTDGADLGLRTFGGGQYAIQVEGFLAIQSKAAPPLVVEAPRSPRDVFAVLNQAPMGGAVTLEVRRGPALYCSLTVASGSTVSNVVNGATVAALAASDEVTVDIVSVPPGAAGTPGRDLTVVIRT